MPLSQWAKRPAIVRWGHNGDVIATESDSYLKNGFFVVSKVVPDVVLKGLEKCFEMRDTSRAGTRQALEFDNVWKLADGVLRLIASEQMKDQCFAVRGILFDKNPKSNWKIPWHQDLTIGVREKHELPGFTAWSVKEGVVHVKPPSAILKNMIAVRLHVDDCDLDNGPIRVIPGSHLHGKLSSSDLDKVVKQNSEVSVLCKSGDVLVMSPLIVHASSVALSPSHRRVVHIEYAACTLPPPLQWAWQ